jgi:hypothetical protein
LSDLTTGNLRKAMEAERGTFSRGSACPVGAAAKPQARKEKGLAMSRALSLLVATLGGPTMFARIGVMRALNRHVERVFNPDRKDPPWGKRKLARDR